MHATQLCEPSTLKKEEAPTFILTTVLHSCQCPCFSLRCRSRRAWELGDRPSRQARQEKARQWEPMCCSLVLPTSFDPCIPQPPSTPLVIPLPCHHPCLRDHLQREEDWIVPIGLGIFRCRDYHK